MQESALLLRVAQLQKLKAIYREGEEKDQEVVAGSGRRAFRAGGVRFQAEVQGDVKPLAAARRVRQ